jgi:hypothetical protein
MSGSFLASRFARLCDRFWIVDDMRYLFIGLFVVQILYCPLKGQETLQGLKVD